MIEYSSTKKYAIKFFFEIVLPPILFSAGFHLKKSDFFKNFKFISMFGILGLILIQGTIITYIIVLGLTILLNEFD